MQFIFIFKASYSFQILPCFFLLCLRKVSRMPVYSPFAVAAVSAIGVQGIHRTCPCSRERLINDRGKRQGERIGEILPRRNVSSHEKSRGTQLPSQTSEPPAKMERPFTMSAKSRQGLSSVVPSSILAVATQEGSRSRGGKDVSPQSASTPPRARPVPIGRV